MECFMCRFYKNNGMENKCELTHNYNFREIKNCNLVGRNRSVNLVEIVKDIRNGAIINTKVLQKSEQDKIFSILKLKRKV